MMKNYATELENLIMEMLPMYQAGCRSSGAQPDTSTIIKKLMEIRRKQRIERCALLDKDFSELDQS